MAGSQRLTGTLAVAGAAGFLALAAIVLLDALLSFFAGPRFPGLNELAALLISLGVVACLPAGLAQQAQLRVDLLHRWLPVTVSRRLERLSRWLLLAFVAILAFGFIDYGLVLGNRGQVTPTLGVPLAAFYMAIGAMLALAAIIQLGVALSRPDDMREAERSPKSALGVVLALLAAASVGALVLPLVMGAARLPVTGSAGAALFVAVTWALILIGAPIGAVLGLAGVSGAAVFLGGGVSVRIVAVELSAYFESEKFAVLPLFLLMGSFAAASGIASDVYRLAQRMLYRVRGGLAVATVLGCAGFGAVTGSSVATLATLGRVALPEMQRFGYSRQLATGSLAAGGTLGMLIPPSSILVLYAILTEVSIGQMFLGAIGPVLISILLYCLLIVAWVTMRPAAAPAAEGRPEPAEGALAGSLLVLALGTAILGGLYSGYLSILQAASFGVLATFVIALGRGTLSNGRLRLVATEAVLTTSMIYLLIIGGITFSYFIGITEAVEVLIAWIAGFDLSPMALIIALAVLYLLLGHVVDPIAVLIITAPIVAPLVQAQGFSLVWWGIVMIALAETGMLTPPMGLNVFILKGVAGKQVPLSTIFWGVTPFVLVDLVKIALLIAFPVLVLWLPGTS